MSPYILALSHGICYHVLPLHLLNRDPTPSEPSKYFKIYDQDDHCRVTKDIQLLLSLYNAHQCKEQRFIVDDLYNDFVYAGSSSYKIYLILHSYQISKQKGGYDII